MKSILLFVLICSGCAHTRMTDPKSGLVFSHTIVWPLKESIKGFSVSTGPMGVSNASLTGASVDTSSNAIAAIRASAAAMGAAADAMAKVAK